MDKLIPYVRQSRKKERTISIDEQRADITRWAEREQVELIWDDEYTEQGVSGSKHWKERGIGKAIEAVQRGEAAGIVVAYQSRLSRENGLGTAEVWDALEKAQARLVCVAENIDTSRGGEEEFSFGINAVIARREWKRHRGNFSKGKHNAWESGVMVGPAPTGYESPVTGQTKSGTDIHGPLQKNGGAEAIGRAFAARANGASWSEVARLLTDAGVTTFRGETTWSTQAVRKIVTNSLYKGEWRCSCGCGESKQRSELAVVRASLWAKAQPTTSDGVGRKDAGTHLLSGLLTCGGCGRRLIYSRSGTTKDGTPIASYRCNGGLKCQAHANIHATKIETIVKDAALDFFMATEPTIGHDTDVERLADLEHKRDQAIARQAAFIDAADPLDAGYKNQLGKLRAAVQDAEAALLEESSAQVEHVTEEQVTVAFREAPIDEQRQLLRMVLVGAKVTKDPDVQSVVEVFTKVK
jgi:DNA invertase Pin-like site-specific DNA recombinase